MSIFGIFKKKDRTHTISKKEHRPQHNQGSFTNNRTNEPVSSAYPCETYDMEEDIQNKDVNMVDETLPNDTSSTKNDGEIVASTQTADWGLNASICNPPPTAVPTEDDDQEKTLLSDSNQETAVVPPAEDQVSEEKADEACSEKVNEASIENKDNIDTGTDQCACLDNVNEDASEAALLKLKLKFMSELIEAEEKIKKILKSSEIDNDSKEFIISYIDDVMFFNGATPIEDETLYNPLRHKPSDHGEYPHDTPIIATVFQGIEMDDRVLRRAIVDVKENK